MAEQAIPRNPQMRGALTWWQIILLGFVLFVIGVVILVLTANPALIPAVIMLGNFTVPIAFVIFFYERQHLSQLTLADMLLGFVVGGVLGLFAAALLEPLFVTRLDPLMAFVVGLIEEFAKITGVVLLIRRRPHNSGLDGLLLGAAAGMGFAALESTGYAFVAFLGSQGSLSALVSITLLRGFLSPFGHGTWTAIFASVIFRESGPGGFRITRNVVGAYLVVSILHGLWDGLPGIISLFVSGGPDVLIGQILVAGLSIILLARRWTRAVRAAIPEDVETRNPVS